jgi:hypothetical protein
VADCLAGGPVVVGDVRWRQSDIAERLVSSQIKDWYIADFDRVQ